jgi:predicted Zn-dependent protease
VRVGVADSRVESVRSLDERERAVRVYAGGRVGLASAVGGGGDGLVDHAREALTVGVPYAPAPEAARRLESARPGRGFDAEGLAAFTETLLAALRRDFPRLAFGNAVTHATSTLALANDAGVALSHHTSSTAVALTVHAAGSLGSVGGGFDTVLAFEGADLEPGAVLGAAREHLEAFLTPSDESLDGEERVIFRGLAADLSPALARPFVDDLAAPTYRARGSRFAGGLESGARLLSEALTLVDRRDPAHAAVCPFDHEGVVRDPLDLALLDRGVLRAVASDKRDAIRYGVPHTGCAAGAVAELPSSGLSLPDLLPTVPALPDLLDGEPGVVVWLSLGGAWTPEGALAMPAQVAFRVDAEGRPRGRLQGLSLRGELFAMFGAGFLGVTEQAVDPWTHHRFVGCRMHASTH